MSPRIRLAYRKFLNLAIITLLVSGLTSACISPSETLEPPSATLPPTTAETAAPTLPSTPDAPTGTPTGTPAAPATPEAPTVTPVSGGTPDPDVIVIEPGNLDRLQPGTNFSTAEAVFLTWAGDETLALASEQKIEIFNPDTLQRTGDIDSNERPTVLASAPDQGMIAWAGFETHQIYLLEADGQAQADILATLETPITSLAFSPDGEMLAAAGYDNVIYLYDLASREQIDAWQFPSWITDLTFSPDGTQLAGVESEAFTVHIWDAQTGEELHRLMWADHAAPVLYGVTFSPDWQHMAWVARGTILIMEVATGIEVAYLGHEDFVNSVAWSPDSRLLASSAAASVGNDFSPVIVMWDPLSGERLDMLITPTPAMDMAFSPDGSELASLHVAGEVQIWRIQP